MTAPRRNASTVLGKRSHQTAQVEVSDSSSPCDSDNTLALPTPDSTPNPKRAKTTGAILDGDHNKENIPPFGWEVINASPTTRRLTRSLRRTSTVSHDSSSRPSSEFSPLVSWGCADVVASASAICVHIRPATSSRCDASYVPFPAFFGDSPSHTSFRPSSASCSCKGAPALNMQRRSPDGRTRAGECHNRSIHAWILGCDSVH